MEYDTLSVDGASITTTGDSLSIRSASGEEMTAYQTQNTQSIPQFELYYITETTRENIFVDGDNTSPFVTTSPKTVINDAPNAQWLTGDGLKRSTFVDNIDADRNDTTNPKRYQTANTAIGNYDTSKIIKGFSTAFEEFGSAYGGEDFHMLILEDTDPNVTTPLIVNYLRLLTNTAYDFADDTYNVVSEEKTVPFKVVTKQFVYQNGMFVGNDESPNLQYNSTTEKFLMTASDIDSNADHPQFTLLDVQFFDPSDTNSSNRRIAYHLYVPVYTRKIIQFVFSGAIVSGTYYYPDPYRSQALFENLGTPVTMKLSYSYGRRTAEEWINAINGGENVMGNYNKSLNLTNETGTWKAGTKLVLVDSSNNGKVYYCDNFNSTNATTDLSVDFKDFKDDNNISYAPVPLYQILNVVVGPVEASAAKLVKLKAGDDVSTATVCYNGEYYKPNPDIDYRYPAEGETYVSYTAEDTQYAVTSVTPQNTENYYLSIFTPKASVDEPIHHFAFTSPDTMSDKTVDAVPKSKIYGASPKIDYYTGDLYKVTFDSFTTSNGSVDDKMTETYNSLDVYMKTTIEWTAKAKALGEINLNLQSARDASIFQTFLMTYSMVDENLATKVGIQPGSHPDVGIVSYTINGTPVLDIPNSDQKSDYNLNYIEFANGVNLKPYLEQFIDSKTIIEMRATIEYDSGNLSVQFPPKAEDDVRGIGTRAIAYSKVASAAEAVNNSPNQADARDTTHLYYTDTSMTATLKYTLDFTKSGINPAGPYNDLGINSFDKDNDSKDPHKDRAVIHTEARYDTSDINRSDEYIELSMKLYTRAKNDESYASTPLTLGDYLNDVKIYGSDGTTDLMTQPNAEIVVTKSGTEYKLRAKKSLLMTEGDQIYIFPITLDVKTGDAIFNNNGRMYANYKIVVSAKMCSTKTGNDFFAPSYGEDYLIYTNARMDSSMQ